MAREIRITVDDDEVFERMKARKNDLDLTWEEVLQRGLGSPEPSESPAPPDHPEAPTPPDPRGWPGEGFDPAEERTHGRHDHGRRSAGGRGQDDTGGWGFGDFAEQLQREVQEQVRSSLQSSLAGAEEARREVDREMRDLQQAEDAVLRFPVLDDDRGYEVPLRVNLATSRDGLSVDVVAIRQGKSVTGTNRFDRSARRAVNEHLARGGTATLAFGTNGEAETYDVAPVLSWGRTEDGSPTVTDVAVDEVLFDDAN